tara:strand:+ start:39777 stop:40766 length:990 start_codon:yes stop_codon:yes gene_type:complete
LTTALTDCLILEAESIKASIKNLSNEEVERTFQLFSESKLNKSKLLISGVGKSGIVARKIAATFSSIGLISLYLNPLDALHGDIGIVAENDLVILLSNSGETEELIEIIPHLKNRSTKIIGILGKINSSIAEQCDAILDASVDKEVCPLNLAPTASTSVAMAIGDALVAVWMDREGISFKDFATNHPAGNLGKKLTILAKDLMIPIKDISKINKSTYLPEIIIKLSQNTAGACLVIDIEEKSKLIGLITDGDLRRVLQNTPTEKWNKIKAEEFMTYDPITISESVLAIQALEIMERNRKKAISVLPVFSKDNRVLGLLRLHDLVKLGLS